VDAAIFQLPWQGVVEGAALTLRAAGFASIAPIIGADSVPLQLRAAFGVLLAVLVAPLAPAPVVAAGWLFVVSTELFIGVILGFVARLAFEVLLFAGTFAGYPTGLAAAAMMDPVTQTSTTALAVFYQALGGLLFLVTGGLREVVAVLVRSYQVLPAGTAQFDGAWLPIIIAVTGQIVVLGFRLAAPLLVAGLLADICLMLIARAVPQMNILVVGAPIRTTVGLVALAFSLHVFGPAVSEAVGIAGKAAGSMLGVLRG
jgi:flagellar biosynthetic protein FliR